MDKTVLVFGANGKVGSHFVKQALVAGYKIRAFVRSPEKYGLSKNPNVEVIKGDATKFEDVKKVIPGADIIVSCLGNPSKKIFIMEEAYDNIISAASEEVNPPRCLMISSIGIGGSS